MIRKPPEPPYTLLLLAAVGVALMTPVFWYVRFVRFAWPTVDREARQLSLSQAWDCLAVWKLSECRAHLESIGTPLASAAMRNQVWVVAPLVAAVALLGICAYLRWFAIQRRVIVSGMVVEGMDALLKAGAHEQKNNRYAKTRGIHMFNGWHYTLQRETNHTFILGAPGGGKTVTFRRMIGSVVARGDKAIIFDEKGDYTRIVPHSVRDGKEIPPLLIAPQDDRSAVWDIAADLVVSQDAVELAQRIIPDNGHPFFTQSARAVLAGCAIKLMAEKPNAWTWLDLLNETRQDQEQLLRIMLKYQRGADIFLTADYKQVMSTLGQLETNMRLLEMLATAWPTYEGRQRFRLREWLVNKTDQRTVIIQHSGRYAELSDGWISALYAVAVSTVTDSNLLSDNDLRRLWFFLDEWGQLPEIRDFERFITLGRSKGVCAVLGLQDLSQIAKNYGQEVLDILMASVGTKIITRINFGPTAERMERDLGETTFYEYRRDMMSDGSVKWIKETHVANPIERSEFDTMLGVDDKGVLAFVTGVGKNVYHVKFPFADDARDHRPSNVPAAWTYTFKPTGTFTSDADIDLYVKAVLGNKTPPPRGALPAGAADQEEELPLEEAFNAAAKEARENGDAEPNPDSSGKGTASVDLFENYR